MDAHEVIARLKREARENYLRTKQIDRMLEAHHVPNDEHTVLALLTNMLTRAEEVGIPVALIAVMIIETAGIPYRIVEEEAPRLDPDTLRLLARQIASMPRHGH